MNWMTCDIENTISALQKAIKNKKNQMRTAQVSLGYNPLVPHLFSEILHRTGGSYAQMTQAWGHSREFLQHVIKTAQQNMKDRPWEVLRKVAVFSFGVGLFFSLRHQKPSIKGKE